MPGEISPGPYSYFFLSNFHTSIIQTKSGNSLGQGLIAVTSAAGFFIIAVKFFMFGLKNYQSLSYVTART
jgi:hypothetical protein